MKVKIDDRIYDSENEPIMLILNDADKNNISNMGSQMKYCSFPDDDTWTEEQIREFMKV